MYSINAAVTACKLVKNEWTMRVTKQRKKFYYPIFQRAAAD